MRSGAPTSDENAQHVIVRIAIVNDERQACAFRDLDVGAKSGLLHERIDAAPVVVETGFSNSADVGKLRPVSPAHRRPRR